MYIYHKDGNIVGLSCSRVYLEGGSVLEVGHLEIPPKILIRDYEVRGGTLRRKARGVKMTEARIAFVSVWGIPCGISTYTEFLVDEMRRQGYNIKIFAERYEGCQDDENTAHCWTRGTDLSELQESLKDYDPDFIYVQHEYGIFPDARHWTKFVSFLDRYNYVVALHSVYWHKDKTVCEAICRNLVVHSQAAKEVLEAKGISAKITVIPHGCIEGKDLTRLWNIYRSPHTLMQFGFGFEYKGWGTALEAVRILKEKYSDIFYLILFSESSFSLDYHSSQFSKVEALIKEKGLVENVAVIRGFQKEEVIDTFLRTVRVAVFPYTSHPDHIVYGSTGAARIAMANGTPTIVSQLPLFSDLEGIVPRVHTPEELAAEIDKLFSSSEHYNLLREKEMAYVKENSWEKVAKKYLNVFR